MTCCTRRSSFGTTAYLRLSTLIFHTKLQSDALCQPTLITIRTMPGPHLDAALRKSLGSALSGSKHTIHHCSRPHTLRRSGGRAVRADQTRAVNWEEHSIRRGPNPREGSALLVYARQHPKAALLHSKHALRPLLELFKCQSFILTAPGRRSIPKKGRFQAKLVFP
jgi:hypothetical protein